MGDSAGFEAEEEHYYTADDGEDADPVDGFDACEEGGARGVEFEEEDEHDEGEAIQG